MAAALTIYRKTDTGLQEIQGPLRNLPARQRQLLILVDGEIASETLRQSLASDVDDILRDLLQRGYIYDPLAIDEPASASPTVTTEKSLSVLSPEIMAEIRQLLLASIDDYLGIMGGALRRRVTAAGNSDDLQACIPQWHMALRESKGGRAVAEETLQALQRLLDAEKTTIHS